MPGMKVTVSAAMRARDVSRPQPQHEAAAEQDSPPARPGARAAPRPSGSSSAGQAVPRVPPPAPRHRPAPPAPRRDGAIKPERGQVPRPGPAPPPGPGPAPGAAAGTPGPGRPADASTPRPTAAPAREPRQREPAPGRESPGHGQPDEPRDARGSVMANNSGRPPGDGGSDAPAAPGRPAKRKRVRRRRSRGR